MLSARLSGAAEPVLFPQPLHLTREVHDPLAGSTRIVDEYCFGNRVVSIIPGRTAIADYGTGTLTVIDFRAGTHSVTPFAGMAEVSGSSAATGLRKGRWKVARTERTTVASHPSARMHFLDEDDERHSILISTDDRTVVSRAAAEVLLGTAYPARQGLPDAVLDALGEEGAGVPSGRRDPQQRLRLPLEQIVRLEVEDEVLESRSTVVRVGAELPPSDAVSVPPGSRLVDGKAAAARRLLEELDAKAPRAP